MKNDLTVSGQKSKEKNWRDIMASVVKLGELSTVEPILGDLDGWKVVEGTPSMKTWILHSSEDSKMISGYWEATPGTYHATYTGYEFVHLIAGRIVITPDGGDFCDCCRR